MASANSQPFDTIAQETREQVLHAKEKALDDVQFERFYEVATRLDDPYYQLQCQFAALILGRLGFRAGELVHFQSDWVDTREQFVTIPPTQRCHDGRNGGLCSTCVKNAKQMADRNEDLSLEDAKSLYWKPKSAGSRSVYYGFSPRLELVIERFIDEWEKWPVSYQTLLSRIDTCAEPAVGVDDEELTPHPLRATAATFHAARGLKLSAMMQHFGWSDPTIPTIYINRSPEA